MKVTAARASLEDVAREAGVSLATVDRVLHRRPGVRPQTVERVNEVIGRIGFRPDPGRDPAPVGW